MPYKLNLSETDILEEIEVFKLRRQEAQEKLNKTPETLGPWKARKATMAKRKTLEAEIDHVNKLIVIARSALSGGGA